MTYLKQTRLHTEEEDGNCWSTCIACLLNLRQDEIPELNIREAGWRHRTNKFINKFGYDLIEIQLKKETVVYFPDGLVGIACGDSPRQPHFKKDAEFGDHLPHAVIGKFRQIREDCEVDGKPMVKLINECEMLHDPHPDNTFINSLDWMCFLIPIV